MTDNLALWNSVARTDPRNTKRVNQRGGFTAIAAHSQIMEATRAFGPIGQGWGYETGVPVFADGIVFVPVTVWHGDRGNSFGPMWGGAEWRSDKGRLDSDAAKKATTDGLTKCLSQIGFNADVFLGLFDDNKYVQQVAREFAEAERPANDAPTDDKRDLSAKWTEWAKGQAEQIRGMERADIAEWDAADETKRRLSACAKHAPKAHDRLMEVRSERLDELHMRDGAAAPNFMTAG